MDMVWQENLHKAFHGDVNKTILSGGEGKQ